MVTGTHQQRTGEWRLAFAYAAGTFCALALWSAANPHQFSGASDALARVPSLAWVLFICGFASVVCLMGFRAGLEISIRQRRQRVRDASVLLVFGIGLLFPITVVLLAPLFSMFRAGLLPALAWAFLGSMLAGQWVGRIARGAA
jgi:hypothetical protein